MRRRAFLIGAAATSALAAPHVARAAGKSLRFVPQANLANLDPVWGTQYVVRNASLLIWDTLYGVDETLTPRPQMAEGHEVGDDGKTWTFRLRDGLQWHDGGKVTPADCVASIKRWAMRDTMGAIIRRQLDAIETVDDRSFRIRMNKPFGKMLFALGKSNSPVCFMMPERIATTDPFKQISDYVGSGPMRFLRDEWVPGSHAAFAKFEGYVPRDEKASWISGGKRMLVDRIDWQILPDPATAAAALQNGEVDWWETPLPDLIPLLRRNRDVAVDIADPLGNIGSFRMNHLYPPFNDVRARRAMLMALDQTEYMTAVTGGDETAMRTCPSFFTPGTALYTEDGGDLLKGPRRYDEAKTLLEAGGYKGEPVVLLVASDIAAIKAQGDVTADALKRIGMNVDYVALDWGTVGQRRAKKDAPDKGGWNIFHTWHAGADCVNPAPYTALDASGDTAWFGWPKSDAVQAAIHDWYEAPTLEAEKAAIAKVNRASFENVTYVPTGFFQTYQAWRRDVSGVSRAPFPVFWGVAKA